MVGAPCTPMLATTPPGRTTRVQRSNVCGHADGLDRHVRALSGVGQRRDLCLDVAGAAVERVVGAESASVLQPGVGEVHRDDARRAGQPAVWMAARPTGPAPDHDDHVAGLDPPLRTPTS